MCDHGRIITFLSIGVTIFNEHSGNRFELECFNGVYRVMIDASAKVKSRVGSIKKLMGFEQDSAGAEESQPARFANLLVLPSEAEAEQLKLTHLPFSNWCRHCACAKGRDSPHPESSPGGVSNFATDYVHGRGVNANYHLSCQDGLTTAFFANVEIGKGTSRGQAE